MSSSWSNRSITGSAGSSSIRPRRIHPGGRSRVVGRVGQLVAGELLEDEPVVGLVAVERVDHPVAILPGVRAWGRPARSRSSRRSGPGRASAGPTARRSAGWRAGGRPAARRRRARVRRRRLATSSGVGGRPIRSKVRRRIRVAVGRPGAGFSALALRATPRTKASIGLRAEARRRGKRRAALQRSERPGEITAALRRLAEQQGGQRDEDQRHTAITSSIGHQVGLIGPTACCSHNVEFMRKLGPVASFRPDGSGCWKVSGGARVPAGRRRSRIVRSSRTSLRPAKASSTVRRPSHADAR